MFRAHRVTILTATFVLGATVVACNDVAGTARVPVSLSVSGSSPSATASVAASPALRATTISGGANTIVITKAQIVLARIELDRTAAASCATSDDRECEELKLDPMLVDLPVTQAVQEEFSVTVPAGTYNALEARIRAPRSGEERTAAFLTAHPEFAGKSVHVEGTFNGTPFTYDGTAEGELELAFNPPLTIVDGGTNNVTLRVDLSTWFRDGSGNVIDPASSANASLITQNIERSFRAFEDENHDGVDDHESESHGG